MDQDSLRRTLLRELHEKIDAAAAAGLAMVESCGVQPVYPPGVELTDGELAALAALHLPADVRSALKKILRDVAARPLFDLFALVDGVADPGGSETSEPWLGVSLVERQEGDDAMWHDDLFETYWEYPGARASDV
jgi:hypothetical protein